jgi:hypothetical protein
VPDVVVGVDFGMTSKPEKTGRKRACSNNQQVRELHIRPDQSG